jgi:tetratricopeptide (TPR) repeat protein
MGLDMYVQSVNADTCRENVIESDFPVEAEELFYWRKHPNLHGWFRDLFYRKGGHRDCDFNGEFVRIVLQDLIELENIIKNKKLPNTDGFFFGKNTQDRITINNDLNFIKKAKEALANNKVLYFNLGVTSANAHKLEEAEKQYKKAIEIDPNYFDALLNLSELKLRNDVPLVDAMNKLGTSEKDNKRYEILKAERDKNFKNLITTEEDNFKIKKEDLVPIKEETF